MVDKINFYLKIAKNLFDLRTEKKLSIDKFIEITNLDLDRSTYWGVENNKQNISLYQLFVIAKTFGVPILDLLKGADDQNNSSEQLKDSSDIKQVNNL
jgi:transcriptional regulator with XRE-family HTH domain